MTELQELIKAAENLCNTLDIAAQNEKAFNANILSMMEQYSWEAMRMRNDLKQIQDYMGV